MDSFYCCNTRPNRLFKYEFIKPEYKFLAYYQCPVCGKRWFEELKESSDKPKIFFDNVADVKLKTWKKRIFNNIHGTKAKEHFYFGTHKKTKHGYTTFRTNFNNQKEFLFEQINIKTKLST